MKLINSLEDRFENLFTWLNAEPTDRRMLVAQNAVVFGTLTLCIIGAGFAS